MPLINNRIRDLALDFCKGSYDFNVEDQVWSEVFTYLIRNADTLQSEEDKIHTLWTVNGGHLRRKVENDTLLLSVLLKFMPKYDGSEMVLYRGECKFLYDQGKIGFCWTPEIEVARLFARGVNAPKSGGVLLKAYAPSSAIISSPNDHSVRHMEEFEYTCNPTLLENIQVIDEFAQS